MAQDDQPKPKVTRIKDDDTTFSRAIPIVLVSLSVITVLMVLASIAVLFGIF